MLAHLSERSLLYSESCFLVAAEVYVLQELELGFAFFWLICYMTCYRAGLFQIKSGFVESFLHLYIEFHSRCTLSLCVCQQN